ncbi:hypothetical protein FAF44_25045, partial [Nonomuraea sp. MG754425]|uniref:hypothetical protein n=1 Tax=Nonomuraea sp. MG754425 TaxID=2570319 RepID=UPI001F274F3F
MSGLLSELGKRLPDRWLTGVVLPGLLLVALLAVGHRNGLDVAALVARIGRLAQDAGKGQAAQTLAWLVAGAVAAGLAARLLALCVRWLWLGEWRWWPLSPLARVLTRWRWERWERRNTAFEQATGDRSAALAARDRVGLVPPRCPTWMGDRIRALDTRLWEYYRFDRVASWPAVLLVVPAEVRAELQRGGERHGFAASLCGWGLVYVAGGWWWWPSAVAGVTVVLYAVRQGRTSMEQFAALGEAAFDLYVGDLADRLGVAGPSPLDREAGLQLSGRLQKRSVWRVVTVTAEPSPPGRDVARELGELAVRTVEGPAQARRLLMAAAREQGADAVVSTRLENLGRPFHRA